MQISQTATAPTLFSTIKQIAGVEPPKKAPEKATAAEKHDGSADDKQAAATQTAPAQTSQAKSATSRGGIVNLLV